MLHGLHILLLVFVQQVLEISTQFYCFFNQLRFIELPLQWSSPLPFSELVWHRLWRTCPGHFLFENPLSNKLRRATDHDLIVGMVFYRFNPLHQKTEVLQQVELRNQLEFLNRSGINCRKNRWWPWWALQVGEEDRNKKEIVRGGEQRGLKKKVLLIYSREILRLIIFFKNKQKKMFGNFRVHDFNNMDLCSFYDLDFSLNASPDFCKQLPPTAFPDA